MQALCVAACAGIGALLLIVTFMFGMATGQAWGDRGRVAAGTACAVLSAAGVFASFVAARHHWRKDRSRRGPSG